jgi:homoaconitase/3-isopropylmalate dehydratase large subunit
VDGCTAMSCFGVASALDGGRQSVVTYGRNFLGRLGHQAQRHIGFTLQAGHIGIIATY